MQDSWMDLQEELRAKVLTLELNMFQQKGKTKCTHNTKKDLRQEQIQQETGRREELKSQAQELRLCTEAEERLTEVEVDG